MESCNYLRVEGVNIYANLADTSQLSVTRGGSLILKDAIEKISEKFDQLEPITTGASEGIFKVSLNENLLQLENNVAGFLSQMSPYKFMTFTVVTQEGGSLTFKEAKKSLLVKSRFRQFQQPTIPLDERPQDNNRFVCELNGLSPASATKTKVGDKDIYLADAILEKLNYGREHRNKLIRNELKHFEKLCDTTFANIENANLLRAIIGADAIKERERDLSSNLSFTSDIQSLANRRESKDLDNKIAVIYFDGNSFGKHQEKNVTTIRDQHSFDTSIQNYRRKFLYSWIEKMTSVSSGIEDDYYFTNDDNEKLLRMEPLLWGGDEMTFVLPAWLGWEFINHFYEESASWIYPLQGESQEKLTHAGGIVFCSATTPIFRIRALAESLANNAKEFDRNESYFDYIALESIDYPTEELKPFFNKLYTERLTLLRQPLPGSSEMNWQEFTSLMKSIKASLPKSQLYKIVTSLFSSKEHDLIQRLNQHEDRLKKLLKNDNANQHLAQLEQVFGLELNNEDKRRIWKWLHLIELWDYLPTHKEAALKGDK